MLVTYDGHIVHGNEVTGSLLIMSSNGANANTKELSPFTYCTSSGGSAKTQGKKFNMSTHENNTSSVKLHLSCLCFNKFIFILASYTTSNSSSTTRMIRLMIYLHIIEQKHIPGYKYSLSNNYKQLLSILRTLQPNQPPN